MSTLQPLTLRNFIRRGKISRVGGGGDNRNARYIPLYLRYSFSSNILIAIYALLAESTSKILAFLRPVSESRFIGDLFCVFTYLILQRYIV